MLRQRKITTGKWFHPRNLFDRVYEIGIVIKGVDGALELLGALLLAVVPGRVIEHVTWVFTHSELASEPHSLIATHIQRAGHDLAQGSVFAVLFLATHGAVKVALVVALLRQKHWAYPWALAALGLFLAYQVYLLVTKPTFGMAFLTGLDTVIIWLVWREWGKLRRAVAPTASPTE